MVIERFFFSVAHILTAIALYAHYVSGDTVSCDLSQSLCGWSVGGNINRTNNDTTAFKIPPQTPDGYFLLAKSGQSRAETKFNTLSHPTKLSFSYFVRDANEVKNLVLTATTADGFSYNLWKYDEDAANQGQWLTAEVDVCFNQKVKFVGLCLVLHHFSNQTHPVFQHQPYQHQNCHHQHPPQPRIRCNQARQHRLRR